MSVVPLVRESPNPTVVSDPAAFTMAGDALLIREMDASQLHGICDSANVSYDLRVGSKYRDHRDAQPTDLNKEERIELLPGAAVIIQTEEALQLPACMFGYIVPKVTLLQQGLSNTLSKVDPGYDGHLLITLFNLGKTKQYVIRNAPFCALVVHSIMDPDRVRAYRRKSQDLKGTGKRGAVSRLRDFVERNASLISIVSLAFSVVLTIVLIYRELRLPPTGGRQSTEASNRGSRDNGGQ